MTTFSDAVTIVLVEDDEGHAKLIEKTLRRAGLRNRMLHLHNGAECLDYLFAPHGVRLPAAAAPVLVLLDLNLPDLHGTAILQRIKSDRSMKRLPVIVLTTTDNDNEVERCYELGCNIYITKSLLYPQLSRAVSQLSSLLSAIQLPEAVRM